MGIERSQFPELEEMGYDDESEEDQELTDEELQAQREEKAESGGGGEWEPNPNSGTSPETSEFYTDEWSPLDKQLRKEEQEAEDDWWFS